MNIFLQKFQATIDEHYKRIKDSLMNLHIFSILENKWINNTTKVSIEDLKQFVRI